MWSTCWVNWWTSPSSSPTTQTAGCATGCSRPSASTPRERLDASGDPAALRRRHADHYVALAEAAGPHLRGRDHLEWTSVVARDIDNFRAALDWAVETPSPEHALRLVAPLAVHGRIGELAMDWAATAIAIPGGDGHPLVPVVAAWAAWGATMGRDFERAEDLVAVAERAQAALGTRLASVARAQATLAFYRNDFEEARRHAEEWVELARASGDPYELAHALIMLGGALQITEPTLDAAIAAVDEAVRVARAAGIDARARDRPPELVATWLPLEESERALALLDEAIEIGTRIGDRQRRLERDRGTKRGSRRDVVTGEQPSKGPSTPPNRRSNSVIMESRVGPSTRLVSRCARSGLASPRPSSSGRPTRWRNDGDSDWSLEMLAATDVALLEALGEQQVATLAARGAALDITDAVAYLRAEADRALAAP